MPTIPQVKHTVDRIVGSTTFRWALACAEKLGYSRYYKSLSSSVMRD